MIVLIAGATHTGKTVLAQKLLERYHYPYLSIDHLKMGLIRSGQTRLTPEDDEELTPYLWNIVKEIVKTALENGQNLIVEGCYIPFDWQRDFGKEQLRQIHYLCLVMSEEYIRRHFREIREQADRIERRLDDSGLTQDGLLAENRQNQAMCRKYGLPVHMICERYDVGQRVLRRYEEADVCSLWELFRETVHTVNANDYTLEQLAAWAPEQADMDGWNRRFLASDTVVMTECGIVIGFGNMDEAGYLDMLYVHKDRQGQGIGAEIVRELEKNALARGAERFSTYASLTARPFFRKMGYRDIRENEVTRGGVRLINWRMEKIVAVYSSDRGIPVRAPFDFESGNT